LRLTPERRLGLGQSILLTPLAQLFSGKQCRSTLPAPNFGGGMLFTLNRAVDLQIAANQHVRPHLDVTGGTVIDASCTATGTSSTLG